jgi:hypothetical protein
MNVPAMNSTQQWRRAINVPGAHCQRGPSGRLDRQLSICEGTSIAYETSRWTSAGANHAMCRAHEEKCCDYGSRGLGPNSVSDHGGPRLSEAAHGPHCIIRIADDEARTLIDVLIEYARF